MRLEGGRAHTSIYIYIYIYLYISLCVFRIVSNDAGSTEEHRYHATSIYGKDFDSRLLFEKLTLYAATPLSLREREAYRKIYEGREKNVLISAVIMYQYISLKCIVVCIVTLVNNLSLNLE